MTKDPFNLVVYFSQDNNQEPIAAFKDSFKEIHHYFQQVVTFGELNKCIDFIKINPIHTILLIADLLDSEEIILQKIVDDLTKIESLFIFQQQNPTTQQTKLAKHKKCQAIVNNSKQFQKSIDRYFFEKWFFEKNLSSDDNDYYMLKQGDCSLIYSKILKDLIIQTDFDETDRKNAIQTLNGYVADNQAKLKQVKEFQDEYDPASPIWWFTKESCIYGFLDDALNQNDYEMMITLGFFLKDLSLQIRNIYDGYESLKSFNVYRGHSMTNELFKKIEANRDKPWAFNKFLSTSANPEIALQFVDFARENTGTVGVFFEIEIDPEVKTNIFAAIGNQSYYSLAESEILFLPHSVFQIGEIQQLKDDLWRVKLTTMDEKKLFDTDPMNFMKNQVKCRYSWCSIIKLLVYACCYQLAIDMLEKVLFETNPMRKLYFKELNMLVSNNISYMYIRMDQFKAARKWLENLVKLHKKQLFHGCCSLPKIYNNLSIACYYEGDFLQASIYANHALSREISQPETSEILPIIYSNIGRIMLSMGDYEEVNAYFELAKNTMKKDQSVNHPSMVLVHNNLLLNSIYKGDYVEAWNINKLLLEIYQKYLPAIDSSWMRLSNNMGYIFQKVCNYRKALCWYKDALKVQKKLQYYNSLLVSVYNNMGTFYRSLSDYLMAEYYYENALRAHKEIDRSSEAPLINIYNNMAVVYELTDRFEDALSHYEKSLEISRRLYSSSHPNIAIIYSNLGSVYTSMKNFDEAFNHYQKSMKILESNSAADRLDLARVYNNVGEFYRTKNEYETAKSYYEKALNIRDNYSNKNMILFSTVLMNMAVISETAHNYKEALKFAEEASKIRSERLGDDHSETHRFQAYTRKLVEKAKDCS